jgi:hypothetical protein
MLQKQKNENWSGAATNLQHHTYSIDDTYSFGSSGA